MPAAGPSEPARQDPPPAELGQGSKQVNVQPESAASQEVVVPAAVPSSSKAIRFPLRPGKGSVGTRCLVKANHFIAQLPNKDLHQYDVRLCFLFFFNYYPHN